MLRSRISAAKRLLSTTAEVEKSWPNAKAASLTTPKKYRSALLNGPPANGPPSLSSQVFKLRYNSPPGLQEAFEVSYAYLKNAAAEKYKHLEKLEKEPHSEELAKQKLKLEVEAQINNPEVQFNFAYNEKYENYESIIDYTRPVYRELKRQHWIAKPQMLLMQRLEQLGAIPDTLPTLEPRAEVSLKFLNHTAVNRWIEPGTVLSSNVTTYPPSVKIQEFDSVAADQLYTVLIVNPDVPDLANSSYKTHIQWGLNNVKVGYNDNLITPKRLLEDTEINELVEYLPPVPEKNLPAQRFVLWVFRQPLPITKKLQGRDFDIRAFVSENGLDAIGAHIWRSQWDMNVPKVRELYGLPRGTVFHKVRGDERM